MSSDANDGTSRGIPAEFEGRRVPTCVRAHALWDRKYYAVREPATAGRPAGRARCTDGRLLLFPGDLQYIRSIDSLCAHYAPFRLKFSPERELAGERVPPSAA